MNKFIGCSGFDLKTTTGCRTKSPRAMRSADELLNLKVKVMKKKNLMLILMLFIQMTSLCQYRIDWQNCYGTDEDDDIMAIVETDDGFIVTGCYSDDPYYRIEKGVTLRIDSNGDTIWNRISNTSNDNGVYCMDRLPDGDYIMMYQDWTLYPDSHYGNIGFRKIDADGSTIWERAYGNDSGRSNGNAGGCATSDGGFVGYAPYTFAGGDISHIWGGGRDIWVIRIDGNGDMVWETSVGTTGDEDASSIQQTADGGFLLAVVNTVPGTGNMKCKEHQDVNGVPHLVKLDPDGNVEWSFCYGGSYRTGHTGAVVLDDGYLLYGFTTADDGDFDGAGFHLGYVNGLPCIGRYPDAYLMKTDFDMNTIWCRCYGGRGSDCAHKVFQNEDGGFTVFASTCSIDGDVQSADRLPHNPMYYIGYGSNVSWIFRVDADGELLWERVTGGFHDIADPYPYDVIKHNDREYTIASQMTYYNPSWEHCDIDCPYNDDMPGSGQNFWVYHITDIFDYNGVAEYQRRAMSIDIHPNPANTWVAVDYTLPEGFNDATITLTNSLGLAVYTQTVHGMQGQNVIDLREMPVGVYILTIRCEDHSLTEKVVVAR